MGEKAPAASSPAVRKCMQGNKRANTKPELQVRAMLREMGFPGYRLQWKKCPGHPDIAFPGRKLAIFVNGCFWHRCPTCKLPKPKSNVEYWETKFANNVARDQRTYAALREQGWRVVVLWECQLKKKRVKRTGQYLYRMVSLEGGRPERLALDPAVSRINKRRKLRMRRS